MVVRAGRIAHVWFKNTGARRLADIAGECARFGIPRVCFARPMFNFHKIEGGDAHKPLWVDTMNPISLELLESNVKRAEWVVFSEVFPDPTKVWNPYGREPYVFELLTEMKV
jgi:hypothetical protein